MRDFFVQSLFNTKKFNSIKSKWVFSYLILSLSLTITYQNDYHPALISLTTHVTCCSDQVYLVQHHSNGQFELSDVDSALAYQTEDHPNPQMLRCLRYFVSKIKRNCISFIGPFSFSKIISTYLLRKQ